MTREEIIEYWEQFSAEIDDLYNTCSDAERGILEKQREVVEFTISAIRELDALAVDGEHDEGCAWCKADYTIIDDDFVQPIHKKMIKFCWHCGRKLEGAKNDTRRWTRR